MSVHLHTDLRRLGSTTICLKTINCCNVIAFCNMRQSRCRENHSLRIPCVLLQFVVINGIVRIHHQVFSSPRCDHTLPNKIPTNNYYSNNFFSVYSGGPRADSRSASIRNLAGTVLFHTKHLWHRCGEINSTMKPSSPENVRSRIFDLLDAAEETIPSSTYARMLMSILDNINDRLRVCHPR
jgi:hypothetical protein